jgi:hypothetical protein
MTAPSPVLSPSSMLPPPSSLWVFIAERKNSVRLKMLCFYFSKIACVKLRNLKLRVWRRVCTEKWVPFAAASCNSLTLNKWHNVIIHCHSEGRLSYGLWFPYVLCSAVFFFRVVFLRKEIFAVVMKKNEQRAKKICRASNSSRVINPWQREGETRVDLQIAT